MRLGYILTYQYIEQSLCITHPLFQPADRNSCQQEGGKIRNAAFKSFRCLNTSANGAKAALTLYCLDIGTFASN